MVTRNQALRLIVAGRDPNNGAYMFRGNLPMYSRLLKTVKKGENRQNMRIIQTLRATRSLPSNVQRMIVSALNVPRKTVRKSPPRPRIARSTLNPLHGTKPRTVTMTKRFVPFWKSAKVWPKK
jgi:hypothetical protein